LSSTFILDSALEALLTEEQAAAEAKVDPAYPRIARRQGADRVRRRLSQVKPTSTESV
jgi:hypothetical protein